MGPESSYEITVDGHLVFSKLKLGGYPYNDDVSTLLVMDRVHNNQENDEDENVYGMRKNTLLEKYGVKRFPYRGRRKYTPLVYQYSDGGMTISNDVFGLTIRQFERMFKKCLDRRKTKEQWILNLRYPDKSSNEYLEYLDKCTDCDEGIFFDIYV
ncbi:unnamed protein product [Mytilus edulis]|uniref:Uncharacterized protein n=1 Tax=Mytilus edulis TaxID=6550 RepID=A0A8S3UFL3_MYTED|nr:unnamed protein product [Mytilus edulis]